MVRGKKRIPGLDPRQTYPYYKIQYWDNSIKVWRDIQRVFRDPKAIKEYRRKKINPELKTRIVIVEGSRCRRVLDPIDTIGEDNIV